MSLDTFFGSPEWRGLAYEEGADLFGPKVQKVTGSGPKLLDWYRNRLRTAFGHVSTARLIRNTRAGPLYYLIWATQTRRASKELSVYLSKGEKLSRRSNQ